MKKSIHEMRELPQQLCSQCGLCCNGVLFADVELQRGDDPKRLAALGMDLGRKGRKFRFIQPCSCFDGKFCRIYPDRPVRCRTFECRLLKRVQAGETTMASAQRTVATVRRQVDIVRKLLQEIGANDPSLPLSEQFAEAMMLPMDLAHGEEAGERRGELMLSMEQLMQSLQRDFLV